jgi:hypothetical protein
MMTDAQIEAMPDTARHAWLDSLQGDEKQIMDCATGHKYTLICISIAKRCLEQEISVNYRLRFLEWLDHCADERLTPEIIALVEPMCSDGYEMVREAMKLGAKKALDVYAKQEVFSAFVALNPSLLDAIKLCGRRYGRT